MKKIATKPQKRSRFFKAWIISCRKVRRASAHSLVVIAGSLVSSFILFVGLTAIFNLIEALWEVGSHLIAYGGLLSRQLWLSTPFVVGFYLSTKYKSSLVKKWVNFILTFYFLWIVPLTLAVSVSQVQAGSKSFDAGIIPVGFLAVAAVFLLLTIIRDLPKKILEPSRANLEVKDYLVLENNLRTMILQAVGGLVVILGLYFAWQNAGIADENQRISLEQNRQERFDRFVEMSKDPNNVEQRIMGIAGMIRVADTPGSDLRGDVRLFVDVFLKKWTDSRTAGNGEASQPLQQLPDDINFIFKNYLSDRSFTRRGEYKERAYAQLRGLNFSKLNLQEINIASADLSNANFNGADCSMATFEDMYMRGTHFAGANLTKAFFENIDLESADLTGAKIEGAHFEGARGLTAEQVRKAVNFEKATFTKTLRAELGLP